jgi:hypothetical protein
MFPAMGGLALMAKAMKSNFLGGPRVHGDSFDDVEDAFAAPHSHSDADVETMQVAGVVVLASMSKSHGTHAQMLSSGCVACALDAMRVHPAATGPVLLLLEELVENEDNLGAEVLAAWDVACGETGTLGLAGLAAAISRSELANEVCLSSFFHSWLCFSTHAPFHSQDMHMWSLIKGKLIES